MSTKPAKKIITGLKLAVFAGLLAYIVHVVRQQPFDWAGLRHQFQSVDHPERWAAGLCLLTPVNWGLEALKWQILLRRVEPTRFWAACRGVLAGVSLGFVLPAQLGDTAGRLLSLRSGGRGAAIGASLVSGGMQFYVALAFGAVAWAHYLTLVPARQSPGARYLLALLTGLVGLGVVLGLVRRPVLRWLVRQPGPGRVAPYWQVAEQYSQSEIGLALGAAALRYLVFSGQFYLAMRLAGLLLPVDVAASAIGLVFLAKTITPAFNLFSDLGVREAAALWVFAPFGSPAPVLIMVTLTLWVANLLMPVLVGLVWVWKLKWAVGRQV